MVEYERRQSYENVAKGMQTTMEWLVAVPKKIEITTDQNKSHASNRGMIADSGRVLLVMFERASTSGLNFFPRIDDALS